jgi:transposase
VAGQGTKIHLIMGRDDPVMVRLTGADVHDSRPAQEMVLQLETQEIERFVADKGYDDDDLRDLLKRQQIVPEIPPRKNRTEERFYDKTVYVWRRRIENMFQKIKENRRLAMRFDKLDVTFMAFIALAFIKLQVC